MAFSFIPCLDKDLLELTIKSTDAILSTGSLKGPAGKQSSLPIPLDPSKIIISISLSS